MREILFRGKRIDNGEWVEGYYYKRLLWPDIIVDAIQVYDGKSLSSMQYHAVIPDTVGQYTGLKDKNGKRIFEGDIVRIESGTFEFTGQVVFEQGCFQLIDPECDVYECLWYQPEEMTVLGNIHDNKELMEVEG